MLKQRTAIPTIRNGVLIGALFGALGLINALIQWLTGAYHVQPQTVNGFTSVTISDTGASALLGCVVFLAMLALTFGAGTLTSRSTGKVGTGAFAGFITGVFGALLGGIGSLAIAVALVAPNMHPPSGSMMSQAQVQALLIGTTIGGAILGLLFDAGLGAGMGALGGLIGANTYRKAYAGAPPAPYAPSSYSPSTPYPPSCGMPAPSGGTPQASPYPYSNSPVQQPQSGIPRPPLH